MKGRSIRATPCECERPLPGDDFISSPIETITHAITIHAARSEVWPWLAGVALALLLIEWWIYHRGAIRRLRTVVGG